ncbi:MAG TPA: hypothetical protein VFM90_05520, partial [Cyclobacteriaceae bacterium]|nr:hypothetical protein [Cyclobacteriaceae bacterium]
AVKFINKFEDTAADIAISNKYDYVVCGHIHKPEMRQVLTEKGSVMYLNSGDWIENLTTLEYTSGNWRIYRYQDDPIANSVKLPRRLEQDTDEIFRDLVNEFLTVKLKSENTLRHSGYR